MISSDDYECHDCSSRSAQNFRFVLTQRQFSVWMSFFMLKQRVSLKKVSEDISQNQILGS